MTALTTVPSMPKLATGLKEIFDPDLILGLGLAIALDFTLGYVAIKLYPPLKGRPFGAGSAYDICAYDDLLMFAIEIGGVLLTKGRLRKIFIYAFWFSIFHLLAAILQWKTGIGFM
jgi:hypothetical protein